MLISRVFIERPILASVVAIVILLGGAGALLLLPVEQYPDLAPPTVTINATYPGASAETVETTVTQLLERQLTGIDGMMYFSSLSSSQGYASITATFAKGTNPDLAQVQMQNKAQQALPRLPQPVQQLGLRVSKSNPDFVLVATFYDETGTVSSNEFSDFVVTNLQEPIGRLPGVGSVRVFGAAHAMRIWLDPFKLASFGLMPSDVRDAVSQQNGPVATGSIGAQPMPAEQMLNAMVTSRTALQTVDQFRNLTLKTKPDGSRVRLSDVARVELGSEDYSLVTRINGKPGTGMGIQLAPGADALATAELVKAELARLAPSFPAGTKCIFTTDATAFIRTSIAAVVRTLIEAIGFVVVVMLVTLKNWRATLIATAALPVVLLGTFGVLAALGFSVNTLTLFGLVLAIGLLVDDAIVVVENVERILSERPDLDARVATLQSMSEIQTALIAIALVLSVVFTPMAFFGGSSGVIYRQFSITMISSMVLSVTVALVLIPALTATLLQPHGARRERSPSPHFSSMARWLDVAGARGLLSFNALVQRLTGCRRSLLAAYCAIGCALTWGWQRLPTGFLPSEDQGSVTVQYTLPVGATQGRTLEVAKHIEDYFLTAERENLVAISTLTGFGFSGTGQNTGLGFLALAPWSLRKGERNTVGALVERSRAALSGVRDAQVVAFTPPPAQGLGQSNGFTLELLNVTRMPRDAFTARRDEFLATARADPALAAVRPSGLEDIPTVRVDVDEQAAGALGVALPDVYSTLSAAWGSVYQNDFLDEGWAKRVYMQGDAPFRASPSDLSNWFVRSSSGKMAPLSALTHISWSRAPAVLSRFGGLPAYEIQGEAAPGRSSGEAMQRLTEIAASVPGTSVAWSGLSYQERQSGQLAPLLYAFSGLAIFLCLAALYESWTIPLAVLLIFPLGLFGALLAAFSRGLNNDTFFQVGILTTMGLAAKNAILIVEFAERARRTGMSTMESALEAVRLRLRPILMTSFAFLFGVLPLAFSSGAGARSRIAIGTTVIGGTMAATILVVCYVPLFFVLLRSNAPKRRLGANTVASGAAHVSGSVHGSWHADGIGRAQRRIGT